MNTENYITGICLIVAAITMWNAFGRTDWRDRAERAEAALAKIEATVSECNEEAIRAIALQTVRDTAPMFRDQAVNTTIAKLKGMETK